MLLYHYTSIEGFLGIISSKNLWASHCQYLNDASEYKHALNFAEEISSNIFMNDDYNAGFGFILRKSISSLKEDSEIFIASFSEEFDLLSQWRGYCPPNDGICIGFDKEIIKEFCTKNNFKFEIKSCSLFIAVFIFLKASFIEYICIKILSFIIFT